MQHYSVSGRSLATAATANHCAAQLWNPSTTIPIFVTEVHFVQTIATVSNLVIQRSSARGATPTATVTPDIDNDYDHGLAPPSASVLELATFSTQPTLATPPLKAWYLPAAIGSGLMWVFPHPIKVKPGAGLCIATPVSVVLQPGDVVFDWDE